MKVAGLLAASASFALAQPAALSLPNLSTTPGATLILPLAFSSRLASVSALRFDLQHDNSALSLSCTIGDAARASGKVSCTQGVAVNVRRFLFMGLNSNPIADGAPANLFLTVVRSHSPAPMCCCSRTLSPRTHPASR